MPPRDSDPGDYRRGDEYDDDYSQQAYGNDPQTEEIDAEPVYEEEIAPLHYDASSLLRPGRVLRVEEEPSTLVARYLFPTEKFRGEWRKHWTYLFDQFAYAALATFIFGWLWGFLVKHHQGTATGIVIIIWILVMIFIAFKVADWYFDRFILTNKRIMAVRGMVSRTVAMMPLLRVTDMKYEQSATGRLFNYGNVTIRGTGSSFEILSRIDSPLKLRTTVTAG